MCGTTDILKFAYFLAIIHCVVSKQKRKTAQIFEENLQIFLWLFIGLLAKKQKKNCG